MKYYTQLEQHFRQTSKFEHLQSICGWDQAAIMPKGGNEARSEAMAELSLLILSRNAAPELGEWLHLAAAEPLTEQQHSSLAAMKRNWEHACLIPAKLAEAQSLAGSKCEHAWREQRPNNDWQGFSQNLKEVVNLARETASIYASHKSCSRYDAMVDLFEQGMSCATLDQVFGELKTWLPNLIDQVIDHQKSTAPSSPKGPFPIAEQKVLGLEVMSLLGFDFNHGRLDVSTHPFCGGVPSDVRMTTRYDENNFISALFGVIHETGHARYEQNLPKQWSGLPVGLARSMGIHESQSLLFEMQLARSSEFIQLIAPMAAQAFKRQQDTALSATNLHRICKNVERGFIRVNADEVTYPAHIILRYEIERALLEGDIEVDHIPDLWNEKMQAYLGVDTTENYRDGCMQDIHWTGGSFGYFPSYTLGAMYAAQFFATAESNINDLRNKIAQGNLTELFNWLQSNIWQKASTLPTDILVHQATGEALNPIHFKKHLLKRYL